MSAPTSMPDDSRVTMATSAPTELLLDDEATAIGFLPDGNYMLTASHGRAVQLWYIGDTATAPRPVWTASVGGLVKVSKPVVAFSGDGRWVAMGKPMSRSFKLLRANDGVEVGRVDWAQVDGWGPNGLAFRPDGWAVAVAYDNIDVWALTADGLGDRLARINVGFVTSFESIAFSRDCSYLAAAGGKMHFNQLFLWQTAGWTQVAKIPMQGAITALAWNPCFSEVAAVVGDRVLLLDVPSGRPLVSLEVGGAVTGVAFGTDGRSVAVGSDDRSARIFDVVSGGEVGRMSRPSAVTSVAFAPDGRLAVGDAEHAVVLWSATPSCDS